jgi:hypothetical protein
MRDRPRELRADFQQTYGLDLDGMGVDYSIAHAACLVAQLPPGARIWRGTPDEWGADTYLLAQMEHTLRVLAWQQTEDAAKRRNYPKPIETPASRAQLERKVQRSLANRAMVDAVLAGKRPQGGE